MIRKVDLIGTGRTFSSTSSWSRLNPRSSIVPLILSDVMFLVADRHVFVYHCSIELSFPQAGVAAGASCFYSRGFAILGLCVLGAMTRVMLLLYCKAELNRVSGHIIPRDEESVRHISP